MEPSTCTVQQVTKSSSDQLLRKFAELEDIDPPHNPVKRTHLIRRNRTSRKVLAVHKDVLYCSNASSTRRSSGGGEWNNALLPTHSRRSSSSFSRVSRRSGAHVKKIIGIGFVIGAIERTLRRTIEGATRALVERHCNSHVRLISDAV